MNPEREPDVFRKALIVGGLLTVAFHGGIEAFTDHGHGPRFEVGALNPWVPETTEVHNRGTERVGDPYRDKITVTNTVPGKNLTDLTEEKHFTDGAYARKFDADPHATELEASSIAEFVATVHELSANGWDVSVYVRGLASAEDASVDATGGLQTPSQDNQRLADFRRDTFVDAVVAGGLDKSHIVLESGEEDSFSDTQMEALQALSQQFGYESVYSMVDAYNLNSESVPPSVSATLSDWLDSKRGVTAIIKATRAVGELGATTQSEKEVCIIPVLRVVEESTVTESWKVTLPYALALPLAGMALVTGAGMLEFTRDMRNIKQSIKQRMASATGAGGDGSDDGDVPPEPQVEPELSEEPEAIKTPPSEPTRPEKEKRKHRKWPWLLPPIIIASVFMIHSCDDDNPQVAHREAQDVCEGLESIPKVVGTKTVTVQNGRVVRNQVNNN